jgi:hypothetical protein
MNKSLNNFENEMLAGRMNDSFDRRLKRKGVKNAFDYVNGNFHKNWTDQLMNNLVYNPFSEMFHKVGEENA